MGTLRSAIVDFIAANPRSRCTSQTIEMEFKTNSSVFSQVKRPRAHIQMILKLLTEKGWLSRERVSPPVGEIRFHYTYAITDRVKEIVEQYGSFKLYDVSNLHRRLEAARI